MSPIQTLRLAAVTLLLTAGLPLLPAVAQTVPERKAEESSVKSVDGLWQLRHLSLSIISDYVSKSIIGYYREYEMGCYILRSI